jgi:membrane protease YdiL (CAAX protease family)
MDKVFNLILSININILIIICIIFILVFQYIISILNISDEVILSQNLDFLKGYPIFFFIIVVILAPLAETLIFQMFIINLIKYFLKRRNIENLYIPILVSTLIFGLQHLYSFEYLINGLFMGFVLAVAYTIFSQRLMSAFVYTAIIHSLVNLSSFIKEFILKL